MTIPRSHMIEIPVLGNHHVFTLDAASQVHMIPHLQPSQGASSMQSQWGKAGFA